MHYIVLNGKSDGGRIAFNMDAIVAVEEKKSLYDNYSTIWVDSDAEVDVTQTFDEISDAVTRMSL